MKSILVAACFALASLVPADAQTGTGDPLAATPPANPAPAVPVMPKAPRGKKDPLLGNPNGLPKPTKAELAEQRKLEHDLKICIGC